MTFLAILDFVRHFLPWIVAGITGIMAVIFRSSAKRHKKRADIERQRAESAEQVIGVYRDIGNDLANLDKQQQNETEDETSEDRVNSRDFFDRDW